jgi:hypothetical protein
MPTIRELQQWVKAEHGFVPKSCWIAHAKELNNIPRLRLAPNRRREDRVYPCPSDKLPAITAAFRHFGLLS